jgi:hypothetical protein
MQLADCWDVAPCIRAVTDRLRKLMMDAVSSPETSFNIYQTTLCSILEDKHLEVQEH